MVGERYTGLDTSQFQAAGQQLPDGAVQNQLDLHSQFMYSDTKDIVLAALGRLNSNLSNGELCQKIDELVRVNLTEAGLNDEKLIQRMIDEVIQELTLDA